MAVNGIPNKGSVGVGAINGTGGSGGNDPLAELSQGSGVDVAALKIGQDQHRRTQGMNLLSNTYLALRRSADKVIDSISK